MSPCDIDTNCNSLKEFAYSMKFKNNKIDSAQYAHKSIEEVVQE